METRQHSSKVDNNEDVEICLHCNFKIMSHQKSVLCSCCDNWFHADCQHVTPVKFKLLSHPDSDDIHWFCNVCNKGAVKMFKLLTQMNERQDKFEEKLSLTIDTVDKLEKEVESVQVLKATVEDLQTTIGSLKTDIASFKSLAESTETKVETIIEAKLAGADEGARGLTAKVVQDEIFEKLEIDKRRSNIVIHNLKEEDDNDDEDAVRRLLGSGLNLDGRRHVESVQRIGKKVDEKVRPIRVKMFNTESRKEVLSRAKLLKDNKDYEWTFITPDLTRNQQKEDKELRDRLKDLRLNGEKDCVIRRGQIVKNGPSGQATVIYWRRSERKKQTEEGGQM